MKQPLVEGVSQRKRTCGRLLVSRCGRGRGGGGGGGYGGEESLYTADITVTEEDGGDEAGAGVEEGQRFCLVRGAQNDGFLVRLADAAEGEDHIECQHPCGGRARAGLVEGAQFDVERLAVEDGGRAVDAVKVIWGRPPA